MVEMDYARLRTAAGELLEESLAALRVAELKRRAAPGANLDELLRRYQVKRTLPPGYYARVRHLLDLELLLGESPPPLGWRATQVRGLLAVRAARAEFDRQHPCCPHCGRPLEAAAAIQCWSCKRPVKS